MIIIYGTIYGYHIWSYTENHIWLTIYGRSYTVTIIYDYHIRTIIYRQSYAVWSYVVIIYGIIYGNNHIRSIIYGKSYTVNHIRAIIYGESYTTRSYMVNHIWDHIRTLSYMVNHLRTTTYGRSYMVSYTDFVNEWSYWYVQF